MVRGLRQRRRHGQLPHPRRQRRQRQVAVLGRHVERLHNHRQGKARRLAHHRRHPHGEGREIQARLRGHGQLRARAHRSAHGHRRRPRRHDHTARRPHRPRGRLLPEAKRSRVYRARDGPLLHRLARHLRRQRLLPLRRQHHPDRRRQPRGQRRHAPLPADLLGVGRPQGLHHRRRQQRRLHVEHRSGRGPRQRQRQY